MQHCLLVSQDQQCLLDLNRESLLHEYAEKAGVNPLFATMPVMLLLLSGTFITTIIWCIYLGFRNKSLMDYIRNANFRRNLSFNYLFALLAGFLWFSQFILFGMGKSKMGPFTFTSWGIFMGSYNCFCNSLGIIQERMERSSFKDLCSDDYFIADYYRIFIYDRNKWFIINLKIRIYDFT